MKRQPKPFYRSQTRSWWIQFGKTQVNLEVPGDDSCCQRDKGGKYSCKHWEQALEAAGVKRKEFEANAPAPEPDNSADPLVVDLIDKFLAACERDTSERTHEWYLRHLESLKRWIGKKFNGRLPLSGLKRSLVKGWIDDTYKTSGDNDKAGAIRAAKRVFNYLVEAEEIQVSPLNGWKNPWSYQPREVCLTDPDWENVKAAIKQPSLLDILTFLRLSGARPHEARIACGRHLDREARCLVFERKNSKGKRRQRVIPLCDKAFAIVDRLAVNDSEIFRNSRGGKWTSHALNHACDVLRKKSGVHFFPYALRHTFATNAQEMEIPDTTISECMGHSGTGTLAATYGHIRLKRKHLRDVMNRLNQSA